MTIIVCSFREALRYTFSLLLQFLLLLVSTYDQWNDEPGSNTRPHFSNGQHEPARGSLLGSVIAETILILCHANRKRSIAHLFELLDLALRLRAVRDPTRTVRRRDLFNLFFDRDIQRIQESEGRGGRGGRGGGQGLALAAGLDDGMAQVHRPRPAQSVVAADDGIGCTRRQGLSWKGDGGQESRLREE